MKGSIVITGRGGSQTGGGGEAVGGLEYSSDLVNHRRAGQLGWREASRPGRGRALGAQDLAPGKASRPWTLVGLTHSS